MPETTAFGAPQEPNRRSFSLAAALQERVDVQDKRISDLHAQLEALREQSRRDAKTIAQWSERWAWVERVLAAADANNELYSVSENLLDLCVQTDRISTVAAWGLHQQFPSS